MSMPHEPLTPEERALAQSLSRLGPHDGPSADLDARILGAARAAVLATPAQGGHVPPTRRRWPLGMGVAASVLLAAGIVWQLRPTHEVPVASEMPADAEHSTGAITGPQEVVAAGAAEAVDAPMADMPATPVIVAEEPRPPAPAKVLAPPVGRNASGPARQNAEAAARQEATPKRSALVLLPTPPSPPAPAAPPQAFPAEPADTYARTAAADSSEAIAEAVAREQEGEQRIALKQQEEQRARYNEERREAAAKADGNTTLDAIAVTGSRVKRQERQLRSQDTATAPAPAASAPPPPPPAASAGSTQPSAARNALRRTDLQVPVDADTRLPPEEWLDRIRLRRDLGDDANALRSLQLFVQEHPFQRVPDDLRPLLGNP